MTKLAVAANLEVERIVTDFTPVNWTYSVRNCLDDWGAPRWIVERFSLKSTLMLSVFTLLDIPLSLIVEGRFCAPLSSAKFEKWANGNYTGTAGRDSGLLG